MSHKNTAYNQIKRHGYKGAAVLNMVAGSYNKVDKTNDEIANGIPLLAYVHRYPSNKVNDTSIFADDRRVLIALDEDFDGVVSKQDTLTVEDLTLSIVSIINHRVNEQLTYVEVQCRG